MLAACRRSSAENSTASSVDYVSELLTTSILAAQRYRVVPEDVPRHLEKRQAIRGHARISIRSLPQTMQTILLSYFVETSVSVMFLLGP